MSKPFKLKSPIGEAYSMGAEDTLNTKKALTTLGHMETPDYGLDEYPDLPMIDAIKSFQRENDLAEDGVMKPDGPTLARLNQKLESLSAPTDFLRTFSGPDSARNRHLASLPSRPGGVPAGDQKNPRAVGMQIAQQGGRTLPPSVSAGNSALSIFQRHFQKKALEGASGAAGAASIGTTEALTGDTAKEDNQLSGNARTDIAPPPPQLPGFEPASERDRKPQKAVLPADTVDIPDLSRPIPETNKPTIFILPVPDEDQQTAGMIVEDRRGNFETKAEIEGIQRWIEKFHPEWNHEGGGVNREDGGLKKEYWIPSVAKTFGGDGRKGGTYVDLSFVTPSGKMIHIQTVDVDPKTGKVTQKELDAADRIRRSDRHVDVILIPKGVQMDKFFKRSKRN